MGKHVIAVPDGGMRERLSAVDSSATYIVWEAGGEQPPTTPDLLVLPYLITADYLSRLDGAGVALVQSQMLGFDGIASYLPPGVTYCNAVGVHEASTAELALALVLAAQRGIPEALSDQSDGLWNHVRTPGLAGKSVVLVGVGGVGRAITTRLAPFDPELHRFARTERTDEFGLVQPMGKLPDALASADIVILAMPLDDTTRGLADAAFLARMKDGALLVNVSRGPVVVTDDLVRETSEGRLRAALDVVDPEPLPVGHPLWASPGVIITPHGGGDTDAMTARIDRVVLEQSRRLAAGEPPANAVLGPGAEHARRA
ncbi:phosphoglycerate dehydrogenase-like enzyme [Microbacteriaceae bacterium SG_E_30_P1]|uniref:Phosphoglycerate dehydrogenase-like enzyme n=1 Tax=Antiquaquibacter oligotrophicus TaxID=2880260 RepID=A0ABT6KPZ8_9MICO|nr:NAD(P)-dependent oxidoreductase [Antiquaquibacter oligotrophicus]MDH6182061.1 phosphoglycerate dehydrogenase-like enzyme [Antiquaquibacter oligotrophicus]UDF12272.1 hydroxyacid dehydrogenase [Antiquaquibacter oligotrophicus]